MKKTIRLIMWSVIVFVLSFASTGSNEVFAQQFKDVSKKHSNYEAIQEMHSKGFISGYPDGTFRPNEPISRKHVAALLNKALKFPEPSTKPIVFTDVPRNHPYYLPIMKLSNAKIVSGGLDGKFNPDSSMTRIQLAKVLDVAFNFHVKDLIDFEDMFFVHWGYVHASALFTNGVTTGDQGSFLPNQPVTRAHYAEFLNRAMKVGANPVSDTVTKSQAIDLAIRLPVVLEGIRIQGKIDKLPYEQLGPKQLPYATASFVNGLLKEDYPHVQAAGDSFLFPMLGLEPSLRLDYTQPDDHTLIVRTIELNYMTTGGGFIEFYFKKDAGKWKIDGFKFTVIGKKHFELTRQEAETILKHDYAPGTNVTYVSKTLETAVDSITKEPYTFDVYTFLVETSETRETVRVNSNDGLYH